MFRTCKLKLSYLAPIFKTHGERSAVHPSLPKQAALYQLDAHLGDV